jgi:hypothetical protein
MSYGKLQRYTWKTFVLHIGVYLLTAVYFSLNPWGISFVDTLEHLLESWHIFFFIVIIAVQNIDMCGIDTTVFNPTRFEFSAETFVIGMNT